MARIPCVVFPDVHPHVTRIGNRRMKTLLCDEDYAGCIDILRESTQQAGTQVIVE